nr:reticulon-like protein B21 [Ipomoea batatas]
MDGGRRKGVVSGSVWESRIRLDEVKGGIKALINTSQTEESENPQEIDGQNAAFSPPNNDGVLEEDGKSSVGPKPSPVGASGKRKTWKAESFEGTPIQIARKTRSDLTKSFDEEKFKELGVKNQSQSKNSRSQEGIERSSAEKLKSRSGLQKQKVKSLLNDSGTEKNSQVKRVKSENSLSLHPVNTDSASSKDFDENGKSCESVDEPKNATFDKNKVFQGEEAKSDGNKVVDESKNNLKECFANNEKKPTEVQTTKSDENSKEPKVAIDLVQATPKVEGDDSDRDQWEEAEEKPEIKVENKNVVKEISASSEKEKPKNIVTVEKKLHHSNIRAVPISPIVKKQPSQITGHARIHPTPSRTKPVPASEESHKTHRPHSRLQSYADLVMWRDITKSAFVFGVGTFLIISSSYVQDFNVSMTSVLSYMGLVYLAVIFTFRSFFHRGTIHLGETSDYVVGEDEAVRVVKFVLPCINEFLLNIRALFSGDPATTMKMAVLLFILAQCGSSITVWKMAKLGFFGVFIVPKVCSSYSSQLTAFGTHWIRRLKNSWESCTHKKAIAFGIFTLAWNLSSAIARIWAVFMLYVAFRYYQQSLIRESVGSKPVDSRQPGRRTNLTVNTNKLKKPM